MTTWPTPVDRIVTHGGAAHRDDFMAVAIVAAASGCRQIERRDPTPEDLADPKTVVLDIGHRHEPELNNFDHHQFPRDYSPQCALTLVLQHLGLLQHAREAWAWLELTELQDCRGPGAVATQLGLTADKLDALRSPIEGTMLWLFKKGSLSPAQLAVIGQSQLDLIHRYNQRLIDLSAGKAEPLHVAHGRQFIVCTIEDEPVLGLNAWMDRYVARTGADVIGSVAPGDRGGWRVYIRREQQAQFSTLVLSNHPDLNVKFIHPSGFLATLAGGREEAERAAALVASQPTR